MTKFARVFAVAVLASVAAFAQTGTAAAAPASGTAKIGIINIQQAIVATNEGRRDLEALQKKFEPKQTELQNLNKEVTDLQNQLKTQGDKLNEEARSSLVKNIDQKQKTLQRQFEDAQSDFQSQQNDIVNRIGQKMVQIMDKYAKQHGYTVILDVSGQQSPVLWAAEPTQITKEIVDAYNAESGVPAPADTTAPKPTTGAAHRPAAKPTTSAATPKKP